jgi:hypothetical protein
MRVRIMQFIDINEQKELFLLGVNNDRYNRLRIFTNFRHRY